MPREALNHVPILAGISEEALNLLADEAVPTDFAPNQNVVTEGQHGHSMFLIRSGRVEVVKQSGVEDEVILATLGQGDCFGEMCIVEPMPRAATVRAAEFTLCWELPSSAFQHLHQKHPEDFSIVILNIARDLARRLRGLDAVFAATSRCPSNTEESKPYFK